MGRITRELDSPYRSFIERQRMFFVSTAPLDSSGRINLSPKGLDTFRILDASTVAYLDYVGSGAETIAHLRENGRFVIMFCAFEGPPKILRLHGRGDVLEPQDAGFSELRRHWPPHPAGRAIVRMIIERAADTCGFGVPLYAFEGERSQLPQWADRKGADGLREYQVEKNAVSFDGLPALRWVDDSR